MIWHWPKVLNQWPFDYKADALAIAPRQCHFFLHSTWLSKVSFMDLPKKVIVYNDFRKVSRWWIIPAEAYKSSNWQKETSNSLLWLPWNPLGCHFSLMDVRKNMSTTRYQTGGAALHSGCLILRLLRRGVVEPSCNYILVFCCIVARIQSENPGCQQDFLLSENEISWEYFEVFTRTIESW